MEKNKGSIGLTIVIIFCSILAGILIIGLFVDFYYFNKLSNAHSTEEIKEICQSEWYQDSTVKNLPVKCSTIKAY